MQTPFGGSKFKTVPYLFVHSRQTEGEVVFGGYGEVDPRGSGTYSNTYVSICAYTEYIQGLHGGPLIDYWWAMDNNLDVTGTTEQNQGVAAGGTLYFTGKVDTASSSASAIPLNTCNGLSLWRDYGVYVSTNTATYVPDITVTGTTSFVAGAWLKVVSSPDPATAFFQSNVGGEAAYGGKGISVRMPTNRGLTVRVGNNAGAVCNWDTSASVYALNSPIFIVLRVNTPTNRASTIDWELFLNGTKILDSDTAVGSSLSCTVVWPTTISAQGFRGIGWGVGDGNTNTPPVGYFDEPFFHWGTITDAQILEMYNRGT